MRSSLSSAQAFGCGQKETESIEGICEAEELRGGDRGMACVWVSWDISGCMDSWTVLATSLSIFHKNLSICLTLFMTYIQFLWSTCLLWRDLYTMSTFIKLDRWFIDTPYFLKLWTSQRALFPSMGPYLCGQLESVLVWLLALPFAGLSTSNMVKAFSIESCSEVSPASPLHSDVSCLTHHLPSLPQLDKQHYRQPTFFPSLVTLPIFYRANSPNFRNMQISWLND